MSYTSNLFFWEPFLHFLWYFNLYESHDSNVFTDAFLDVRKMFQVFPKYVDNHFLQFCSQDEKSSNSSRCFKIWVFPFFEAIVISNDSRIVKDCFQHTLKILVILRTRSLYRSTPPSQKFWTFSRGASVQNLAPSGGLFKNRIHLWKLYRIRRSLEFILQKVVKRFSSIMVSICKPSLVFWNLGRKIWR